MAASLPALARCLRRQSPSQTAGTQAQPSKKGNALARSLSALHLEMNAIPNAPEKDHLPSQSPPFPISHSCTEPYSSRYNWPHFSKAFTCPQTCLDKLLITQMNARCAIPCVHHILQQNLGLHSMIRHGFHIHLSPVNGKYPAFNIRPFNRQPGCKPP